MQITKISQLTGKEHTREIPVTLDQIVRWKDSGAHIQDALPALSDEDREFLISGSTPEEWAATFGDDSEAAE